jgi:DNA ligase (NAD+)
MADEIAELEAQIRHHNRLYWDEDKPEISDVEYDRLVRRLKELAPSSPVLVEMGPNRRFGTPFKHRSSMLSLDKCYSDEELTDWLSSFEGGVIAMPKFDGVACSLHYDASGALAVAATRGDGITGDDVTANVLAIADIPARIPCDRAVEVRGEVYMKLSVFSKFKAEGMANPRNLAAGAIKMKDRARSAAYKLSFAAYDLIGAEAPTLSETLGKLHTLGFPEADHLLLERDAALSGYAHYARRRPELDYEIDGVVFKVDRYSEQRRLGVTSHHPRYALAYKFQGDSGVSTLKQVEWSVARTGAITPVAIVDPVGLSGVTVTRASLHNVAFIDRLGLTLGAKVTLVRRGGVIPNVEFVNEAGDRPVEIPTTCPSCGSPTERRKDFLYCTTPATCKAAILGQLAHYAAVTGMLGFGDAVLEGAYLAGLLRDAGDFYTLTTEALCKLERSGEKLARKLVAEVDKTRTLELKTLLRALGIPDLGKHVSQVLADRWRDLPSVRAVTQAELAATHGIGDVIAENVVQGLSDNAALIDKLATHVRIAAPAAAVAGQLTGKSFVFTGKLVAFARSEAEKRVRAAGGAVLSSVTKQLDFLVVGADKTGGPSTKQKTAEKLIAAGAPIKILGEDELMAMLPTGA